MVVGPPHSTERADAMGQQMNIQGVDVNVLATAMAHAMTDLVASGRIQIVPKVGAATTLLKARVAGIFPRNATPINEREQVWAFGQKGIDYKAADIALRTGIKKENVQNLLSFSHNHAGPWERVSHGVYRKRV